MYVAAIYGMHAGKGEEFVTNTRMNSSRNYVQAQADLILDKHTDCTRYELFQCKRILIVDRDRKRNND